MWLAAQTQRFTFACAQAFGLLDTRTAPCPPADETNTAPRRVIGLGCWLVCGCWPACWGLGNCTRTPCPRSVRPFLAWMTCASTRAACRHACFVADACTFGAQQHLPRLLRSHRLHAFRIRCPWCSSVPNTCLSQRQLGLPSPATPRWPRSHTVLTCFHRAS